jgi:hypothetical protein
VITRTQVLQKWTNEWRTLKAWCRDLSEVEITISDKQHPNRLGTCWSHEQRMVVYKGASIQEDLDTIIHELAHAATIGDNHGVVWQGVYAGAIEEITAIPIPRAADNYRILCRAGQAAVTSWWVSSGNDFLWRLCR